MRYYILFAVAMILLALAVPYLGVRTRDSELTVAMMPNGSLVASTPTYQPPPPTPYELDTSCTFPRLDKDATLVLLSAYNAQSVSSAALDDEKDVAVGAGTLTIEDGDTPLYIVLISFDATIWQVKGAVERVRYLVLGAQETNSRPLLSDKPRVEMLVGATGLEASQVRFLPNKCMHYFKDQAEAVLAAGAIEHYIGRKPDVVSGAIHVNRFSVPSGRIDQLPAGPSRFDIFIRRIMQSLGLGASQSPAEEMLEDDMNRFAPGGVMPVDAKSVVSLQRASRYTILPEEAGILQLLHNGTLAPGLQDGESFLLKQGFRKNYNLVITRPMQFPAGLYGGHARHFVLAPGVPLPTGIVGHSCVKSQTTGQVLLTGAFC